VPTIEYVRCGNHLIIAITNGGTMMGVNGITTHGGIVLAVVTVTSKKISMAKGKPQQIGMTAEIDSIPTYVIQTNVQDKKEAYLDPMFDDVPPLSTLTERFVPTTSS
jgi:hypothetical protein